MLFIDTISFSITEIMSKYYGDPAELKAIRIASCIRSRVNFISGTVTPAQSNKFTKKEILDDKDLEDLEIGLTFIYTMYKDYTLSVQPKYMGSRCNMYLFKDNHVEESYCITRNGYTCNLPRETMKHLYETMRTRLDKFMTKNKIKMIILDGELLPWSALGRNLIENEFLPVDKGLETEIAYSTRFDFDSQLKKLESFIKDTKNEKGRNFKKMKDLLDVPDTATSQKMYDVYHHQMNLYAGIDRKQETKLDEVTLVVESKLEYKAFGILKICFDDGSESIPLIDKSYSQGEMYNIVSDPDCETDAQLTIKFDEKNFQESLNAVKKYFEKLTYEDGFEGIVMKPDYVIEGTLPMMKCRNTSYLTIVYGYDYKTKAKLNRLVKNKSTKSKIKQSVREYQKGLEMLKIKYDEISTDPNYQKILLKFLYDEEIGATLDPRL